MRKSLWFGSILLALTLIIIDFNLYHLSSVGVAVNYVSAQEALPSFVATSTLSVAADDAWPMTSEVEKSADEPRQNSVAAPTTAAAETKTIAAKKTTLPRAGLPSRLIIPSIGLDTLIDPMGLNEKGEMDVPDGSSPHVGWYKGGPRPGQVGSAVIDAHVFAAFKDLRHLKVGKDIVVETADGERLRFIVDESLVYKLSDLTADMLFGRNDARRLNLITCAGSPVGDTYSHRLVVYAKFAEVIE